MTLDVNVRISFVDSPAVAEIFSIVKTILQKQELIMSALDDLKAKVAANTTVIGSAITLLQGLKAKLDEAIASGDPAALQALSDEIGASGSALADAIVANTPIP